MKSVMKQKRLLAMLSDIFIRHTNNRTIYTRKPSQTEQQETHTIISLNQLKFAA